MEATACFAANREVLAADVAEATDAADCQQHRIRQHARHACTCQRSSSVSDRRRVVLVVCTSAVNTVIGPPSPENVIEPDERTALFGPDATG